MAIISVHGEENTRKPCQHNQLVCRCVKRGMGSYKYYIRFVRITATYGVKKNEIQAETIKYKHTTCAYNKLQLEVQH